jgi:hypothetical protein
MDADAVKAYYIARDFLLELGYTELPTIRPNLASVEKRGRIFYSENYRITLRTTFNPLGNLQLHSAALTRIRCEYELARYKGIRVRIEGLDWDSAVDE